MYMYNYIHHFKVSGLHQFNKNTDAPTTITAIPTTATTTTAEVTTAEATTTEEQIPPS